jgi:outer membrane receptor for ferrienterochelin and colicins
MLLFALSSAPSFAQSTSVEILEKSTGNTLPGAHVLPTHDGNNWFFLSDINGVVSIPDTLFNSGSIDLKISFVGYETQVISVIKGENLKVLLIEDMTLLDQVVVTGLLSPENTSNAMHKVSVIERKKIDQLAAVTVDQVLLRETNIQFSRDPILGSNIFIQGLSGQNVKILMDGVPVVGRLNGYVDLSQINLNNVERIEVVEGPLSVAYGSNALAGTINIITKKKTDPKPEFGASFLVENIGTFNAGANAAMGIGKNRFSINLNRNYFDGWNPGDPTFGNPEPHADSSRFKQFKPREQLNGEIQWSRTFNRTTVTLRSNIFNENITHRGYPRGYYQEDAFDYGFRTTRFDNSLNIHSLIGENTWETILAYNLFTRKKDYYLVDLTGVEYTEIPSEQDTTNIDYFMLRSTFVGQPSSPKWRYRVGIDINHETLSGQRIENKSQAIGDYAVYGNIEFMPIPEITIQPGLRYAYNTSFDAPAVPSLLVKYRISNPWQIRLNVATGFRAPSVKELYLDFVDINHDIQGNTDLGPENSIHLSANVNYTRLNRGRLLKASANVYFNDIRNKIELVQVSESNSLLYQYENIARSRTSGVSVELRYTIGHWSIQPAFTYFGIRNQLDETNDFSEWIFSPQATFNVTYDWQKADIQIGSYMKYTGEVPQITISEDDLQQASISDYTIWDLTATKFFWNKRISLALGARNILNVIDVPSASSGGAHSGGGSISIAPGRVYFVKIGLQF